MFLFCFLISQNHLLTKLCSSPSLDSLNPAFTLPLGQPSSAPTDLLHIITTLLARDHATHLTPPLSSILWSISNHISDQDSAKLPGAMMHQRELEPVTVGWLSNWRKLLLEAPKAGCKHKAETSFICPSEKPLTVKALLSSLETVYDEVKDIRRFRRPLANILWDYCKATHAAAANPDDCIHHNYFPGSAFMSGILWNLLGQELVLCQLDSVEDASDNPHSADAADWEIKKGLELLHAVALERDPLDEAESLSLADFPDHFPGHSNSVPPSSTTTSMFGHVVASPTFSRRPTDMSPTSRHSPRDRDPSVKASGMMALITSLRLQSSVRSSPPPSRGNADANESSESPSPHEIETSQPVLTRPMGAISALVRVFCSLVFTPSSLEPRNVQRALYVFNMLCTLASPLKAGLNTGSAGMADRTTVSPRARLACLQFLLRLRADRDHYLYLIDDGQDLHNHVANLAALIHRAPSNDAGGNDEADLDSPPASSPDTSRVRSKPYERLGRHPSRGRGVQPSPSTNSRSRSRVGKGVPPPSPPQKYRVPLWVLPEIPPFSLSDADSPSEALTSYHPTLPESEVLPISDYLELVRKILEFEPDWEILSYVLCHLPVQLGNKHLFCGPVCRGEIGAIVNLLCPALFHAEFATKIERWPPRLKPRDAQGLGYHTLSVLISYKNYFNGGQRSLLVDVFVLGLNGQPATIKCCLHALSLSAFELQPSMTKCMSRILERLAEIMSNAEMAVHILGFLSIVGSIRPLQANFTEGDYRMVFAVALKYLQLHNNNASHPSPTTSFALAQHVRILSYYIVYLWFLAIKVPNRARHVSYITKQLHVANEGKKDLDDETVVCFDWLARYTYGSADPRPANSTLSDVIMGPSSRTSSSSSAPVEKAWMVENAVLTMRVLPKHGWVEITSRRPSGLTKFLVHVENVPLVGPGDVEPDLFSLAAVTAMDRSDSQIVNSDSPQAEEDDAASNKSTEVWFIIPCALNISNSILPLVSPAD